MSKKLAFASLVAAALLSSLVACGGSSSDAPATPTPTPTLPKEIFIVCAQKTQPKLGFLLRCNVERLLPCLLRCPAAIHADILATDIVSSG